MALGPIGACGTSMSHLDTKAMGPAIAIGVKVGFFTRSGGPRRCGLGGTVASKHQFIVARNEATCPNSIENKHSLPHMALTQPEWKCQPKP